MTFVLYSFCNPSLDEVCLYAPNFECILEILKFSNLLLLQEAIANAKSLDEVQQLEAMLKAGQIPGDVVTSNHHGGTHSQARGGGYEMEEEEVEG